MSNASYSLPSINLVGRRCQPSDQYKIILPNISYPSRLHTHDSWSGPSAPLVISKTDSTRYQTSFVLTNSSANVGGNAGIGFHASFEVPVLSWIKAFILHTTSTISPKLENLKGRLLMAHLSFAPPVASRV